MKITLEIHPEQLFALNTMMVQLDSLNFQSQPRAMKSTVAICLELREQLLKKAVEKRLQTKPFKLKLSYYKADALWRYLDEFYILFDFAAGSYEENVWRQISNTLHQKLQ